MVVWYSHRLKNFSQFVVIHTVKGFHVVSEAEVDVFLELSCIFDDPANIGNLNSGFPLESSECVSLGEHGILESFWVGKQFVN